MPNIRLYFEIGDVDSISSTLNVDVGELVEVEFENGLYYLDVDWYSGEVIISPKIKRLIHRATIQEVLEPGSCGGSGLPESGAYTIDDATARVMVKVCTGRAYGGDQYAREVKISGETLAATLKLYDRIVHLSVEPDKT